MDEERETLAGFLREAREAAGLSMAAAAKRALISSGYVHAVEHGRRLPSPEVTARLANAVGADPVRALELRKAIKAAENRAEGERLLGLANAGHPEGIAFVWECIGEICDRVGHERLKAAVAAWEEGKAKQWAAALPDWQVVR